MDYLVPAIALAGVMIATFLIYLAMLPSAFRIERTAEIRAPAATIFPLINDLRNFNRWNPFTQSDPDANIDYSGPESGVGAAYDWSGTRSGAGRMKIATSRPASQVTMNLDFKRPCDAQNIAEFTLLPSGTSTAVTWAMTGNRRFVHKLMGTLFKMDKMVGGEFSKGLNALKAMAEARAD